MSEYDINMTIDDEIIYKKYEHELDSQIKFDNYLSKNEYKQILRINDKLKIIKKVMLKFKDGNSRLLILSKTFNLND